MCRYSPGACIARASEAQLRARAAAEALRAVEDNVSRDVRVAWLNLTDARQRQRTTEQLRDYAGEAYELADARYRAGSSSIVELSQAQLDLTSAQIANANARYDVLIEQSDLNFQLGTLTALDPSAQPIGDRWASCFCARRGRAFSARRRA